MKKAVSVIFLVTILAALALAACSSAHAALQPGCYQLDSNWTLMVMYSGDACNYAYWIAQPAPAATRLTAIALSLGKIMGWNRAVAFACRICNSLFYPLKWRINWCAGRAPYVYIYHFRMIPTFADPAW